jgi:quercetin dioxygenase-like cupin family protein
LKVTELEGGVAKKIVVVMLKSVLVVVIALLVLVVAEYFGVPLFREADGGLAAAAQRKPPAQTVGQSEELLRTLDLTAELDSTKGRPLRMRKITVQPGGAQALHTHAGRPAVTYMLQGEMTYYPEGKPPVVVRAGEGVAEGRTTTHWGENTGKVPAVWIAVDIPTP